MLRKIIPLIAFLTLKLIADSKGMDYALQEEWDKAVTAFEEDCEAKDAVSCSVLAHMYEKGSVIEGSSKKAQPFRAKACQFGICDQEALELFDYFKKIQKELLYYINKGEKLPPADDMHHRVLKKGYASELKEPFIGIHFARSEQGFASQEGYAGSEGQVISFYTPSDEAYSKEMRKREEEKLAQKEAKAKSQDEDDEEEEDDDSKGKSSKKSSSKSKKDEEKAKDPNRLFPQPCIQIAFMKKGEERTKPSTMTRANLLRIYANPNQDRNCLQLQKLASSYLDLEEGYKDYKQLEPKTEARSEGRSRA